MGVLGPKGSELQLTARRLTERGYLAGFSLAGQQYRFKPPTGHEVGQVIHFLRNDIRFARDGDPLALRRLQDRVLRVREYGSRPVRRADHPNLEHTHLPFAVVDEYATAGTNNPLMLEGPDSLALDDALPPHLFSLLEDPDIRRATVRREIQDALALGYKAPDRTHHILHDDVLIIPSFDETTGKGSVLFTVARNPDL